MENYIEFDCCRFIQIELNFNADKKVTKTKKMFILNNDKYIFTYIQTEFKESE